jgi:hypothetical protein
MNTIRALAIVVAVLLTLGACVLAQNGTVSISEALSEFALSSAARIESAFLRGVQQEKLMADTALRLLDLLAATPGTAQQKESLLSVIATTLESELPAEALADKAIQGMMQGVPLAYITQEIETRRLLEGAVRELLFAKGIFSAPGTQRTAPNHLPQSSFDGLVTHVAGALGDRLEAGGSPFESEALYAAVSSRLNNLPSSVIPRQDVDLALDRIEAVDLTDAVLAALE